MKKLRKMLAIGMIVVIAIIGILTYNNPNEIKTKTVSKIAQTENPKAEKNSKAKTTHKILANSGAETADKIAKNAKNESILEYILKDFSKINERN